MWFGQMHLCMWQLWPVSVGLSQQQTTTGAPTPRRALGIHMYLFPKCLIMQGAKYVFTTAAALTPNFSHIYKLCTTLYILLLLLPHEIWVFYTPMIDRHVYRCIDLHAGNYTHITSFTVLVLHEWHNLHTGDERPIDLSNLPDSEVSCWVAYATSITSR